LSGQHKRFLTHIFATFRYPEILRKLSQELRRENATAVPPANLPIDPRGNPKFWDHIWTDFADYGHRRNEAKSLKDSQVIVMSLTPPISQTNMISN